MGFAKNVEPDRELERRMFQTCLAIAATGAIVVVLLIQSGIGVLGIIFFLIPIFLAYWFSAEIAMFALGANEVSPFEAPQLHAIVDKLVFFADMPKPRIAVADTSLLNAFASGRSSKVAVVCVTSGLQNSLNEDELAAVLSHELAHVAHRDVGVMALAGAVGALAGLLTRVSLWNVMAPRAESQDSRHKGSEVAVLGLSMALTSISVMLALALSRYREFAADRTGSLITGEPRHLISALEKVHQRSASPPSNSIPLSSSYEALFILPAQSASLSQRKVDRFSTHPSLESRIERLRLLERQLGQVKA
jgi:heat shock protein HtpX